MQPQYPSAIPRFREHILQVCTLCDVKRWDFLTQVTPLYTRLCGPADDMQPNVSSLLGWLFDTAIRRQNAMNNLEKAAQISSEYLPTHALDHDSEEVARKTTGYRVRNRDIRDVIFLVSDCPCSFHFCDTSSSIVHVWGAPRSWGFTTNVIPAVWDEDNDVIFVSVPYSVVGRSPRNLNYVSYKSCPTSHKKGTRVIDRILYNASVKCNPAWGFSWAEQWYRGPGASKMRLFTCCDTFITRVSPESLQCRNSLSRSSDQVHLHIPVQAVTSGKDILLIWHLPNKHL